MEKETLDKINALTRRKFKAEELYTFPVTICGNEIDRDGERFSDEALAQMAELFVGKTIIQNHDPTAENQVARLYDTELITSDTFTTYGAPYKYLKGYAYMVRTEKNADLITEIDAGIKREVSVSCSAASCRCSVCGKEMRGAESCEHIPGREYGGTICHRILSGINDAYELSFVAVPAQTDAGVTKKSFEGGTQMDFTPITTQADFDAAAQPLIEAAVAAKAAEFEGFVSPEAHQKALDALTAEHKEKLLGAYRQKAAIMAGLPEELAARLTGDTEEEIAKDAQAIAALTKSAGTPHFHAEGGVMSGVEKAFYEKNPALKPRKENV